MIPPTSTFNWATEDPKMAGNMSLPALRTPSWPKAHFGLGIARMRMRNGTWNSNWQAPAMKTA